MGCHWKTSTYWALGQAVLPHSSSFISQGLVSAVGEAFH